MLTPLKIFLLVVIIELVQGCTFSHLQLVVEKGSVGEVRDELDRGANINDRMGPFRNTPLLVAIRKGNLKLVQFLLERGAEVHATDVYGNKPLPVAVEKGNSEIVRLLVEHGADVRGSVNSNGDTIMHVAARSGNMQVVQLLLQHGAACCEENRSGYTPLLYARWASHPAITALLKQVEKQYSVMSSTTPSIRMSGPFSDVDKIPEVKPFPRSNAYAVVIGVEQYRQGLPNATFAARDAVITWDYLMKVMGFQEENVAVLINERATKADIEKYIEYWLPQRTNKDASVFIYFSGHGAPSPKRQDAYLVPYDGDPAFVDATGYPLKRLYEQASKLQAKEVMVMLDSCFSGAGGRSVIASGVRPMALSIESPDLAVGNAVVLAASSGAQVSSTYNQKGHGLLTYYFLKGLQGEADKNKDGTIDLSEIFDYVKPQVERTARRDFNNEQTPQLLGNPELLKRGVRLVDRSGQ